MHTDTPCQGFYPFYTRQVLPALFERLDQAFPEFGWTRSALGWVATRRPVRGGEQAGRIICQQPWGYADQQANATSWLMHVSGGSHPSGPALVDAVRRLATLAGIDSRQVPSPTGDELREADRLERQRECQEAFLAYCHACLCDERGRELRQILETRHGIVGDRLFGLPIGLFTSPQEVAEHLLRLGFSREEVSESWLAGDPRVTGRLVMAWRDRHGGILTLVGRDLVGPDAAHARDLYHRHGVQTEFFGLDVALRPRSGGREHLIVVDNLLDVIFFQSLGAGNVVTLGARGDTLTSEHWEKLVDDGAESVTLTLLEPDARSPRVWQSLRGLHVARRAPQAHVLATDQFGGEQTAAGFARRFGLDGFRNLLNRREHAYRFLAKGLVRKHAPAGPWSDASRTQVLGEAVQFDREAHDAGRHADLERHFWPAIMEATGVDVEMLRRLLGRHQRVVEPLPALTALPAHRWSHRNARELVDELNRSLSLEDYVGFRALILAAARDWEHEDVDYRARVVPMAVAPPPSRLVSTPYRVAPPEPARVSSHWDAAPALLDAKPVAREYGPSSAETRKLAYTLWERNGRPHGMDQQFWFEAEETLKHGALRAA